MRKKFSDLSSTEEILDFLENQFHKRYHHFTTTTTLSCILETRKWRLSHASRMNDLHEYSEKGSPNLWGKIVSTCFSHGDEDNMSMWAMYCIPWENAVRITIPGIFVKRWYLELSSNTAWKAVNGIDTISLHDIAYYDGVVNSSKSRLLWARGACKVTKDGTGNDVAKMECFTGYIKNSAWRQEMESRMSLTFHDSLSEKYFDIPVPDYIFENMELTFGPWFKEEKNRKIKSLIPIGIVSPLRERIISNTKMCFFQNKVQLRKSCDKCKYHFEEEI